MGVGAVAVPSPDACTMAEVDDEGADDGKAVPRNIWFARAGNARFGSS